MAVTKVTELIESSSFTNTNDGLTFEQVFIVEGAPNSVEASVGNAPPFGQVPPKNSLLVTSLGVLFADQIASAPVDDAKPDVFQVTVQFISADNDPESDEKVLGQQDWVWTVGNSSVHINSVKRKEQAKHYGVIGGIGLEGNTTHKGTIIGVNGPDEQPAGAELKVPTLNLSVNHYVSINQVNPVGDVPFVRDVFLLGTHTNDNLWFGFLPGEVLFDGMGVRQHSETLTELSFSFEIQLNSETLVLAPGADPLLETVDILNDVFADFTDTLAMIKTPFANSVE